MPHSNTSSHPGSAGYVLRVVNPSCQNPRPHRAHALESATASFSLMVFTKSSGKTSLMAYCERLRIAGPYAF